MKKIISLLVMALFCIGFSASDETEKPEEQGITENSNVVKEADVLPQQATQKTERFKAIFQIKDIEELRQAINNTIWTHTTHGDVWLKLEFVGNKVKQYGALPDDGEWRYDGESEYDLKERRSQSDGKRFIVATFYPKIQSLAIFELPVMFNFRDYHLYLNGQDIGTFIMRDYEWD